jgi:hypothetical protein
MTVALVALQAHCKPQDRAVATSTRNLMRMLGAVTGLAVSTAIQHAVTESSWWLQRWFLYVRETRSLSRS